MFAHYAEAFARRFSWVQLYTPVNEMYVCAMFSARCGWWNEQLSSDQALVMALKHLVKANVLAMSVILDVVPDALFIQSESSEYFHPQEPAAIDHAARKNAERFLRLEMNYGPHVDSNMYDYIFDSGMTHDEYNFFYEQRLTPHCIMAMTTVRQMNTEFHPTETLRRPAKCSATAKSPSNTTSVTACR